MSREYALILGDCLAELRGFEDSCVDSVVTDPPYELGFMGKKWDASGIAYSVGLWREMLRVLKPGGHLLAFGGTRTYHRMVCAIEDAGFEVRDSLHWIYGTGFPKSLDVSKAIDAAAGATREVVGPGARHDGRSFGAPVGDADYGAFAGGMPPVTAPATEGAKQWSGWGTALKPGHEPIVLARKPLEGTVVETVLKHGTGALNINGCRISVGDEKISLPQSDPSKRAGVVGTDMGISNADVARFQAAQAESIRRTQELGRWPANVIFDEDAARELDAQSGNRKSGSMRAGTYAGRKGTVYSPDAGRPLAEDIVGSEGGGASRFFYVTKTSRKERDYGCEHIKPKSAGEATDREDGSDGLKSPRAGAGRTGGARNIHPTVKPIDLMRYLCRLITPPGGVIVDPFTGSGTTGIAALLEGFDFVGIEREAEYATIAEERISAAAREAR